MGIWKFEKLGCIPRSVGIVFAIGVGTVFIVAVEEGHVTPYLPYISEAGANPPESGLLSITLYVIATLGIMTMFLRYMIIEECNQTRNRSLTILSRVSLLIGIIAMFGMMMVGAYPMLTIGQAHAAGAITLFLGCCIYGILEIIATAKMHPTYVSKSTLITRIVIGVLAVVVFVTSSTITSVGLAGTKESPYAKHWSGSKTPGDEGFTYMVLGAAGEWTLSLLFVFYFLTFVIEFRGVSIHLNIQYSPKVLTDPAAEEREQQDERTPLSP